MNLEKLKKLLWLTKSDNDHEALSAIRNINRIIQDAGKTWDDVFNFSVIEKERIVYKTPRKTVEKLEYCLEYCSDYQRDFLSSLYNGYKKYGRLTEKQRFRLDEIYKELY